MYLFLSKTKVDLLQRSLSDETDTENLFLKFVSNSDTILITEIVYRNSTKISNAFILLFFNV